MLFFFTFGIDEDIIEIYYHENVKLLCQDLIDVDLESDWCVSQSKRHHRVIKMAIAGFEGCFLFIAFLDPHPIVGIN